MHIQLGNLSNEQLEQAYKNAHRRALQGERIFNINSVHPEDITGQVWWYDIDMLNDESRYSYNAKFRISFDIDRLMIVGQFKEAKSRRVDLIEGIM